MNDEQTQHLLGAWFGATDPTPPDSGQTASQVLGRLPEVRQRGRWWPLPVFARPAPVPATSGPQPARGYTMFSALKFITASIIVALVGGFLLTGVFTTQPNDEQPAAVSVTPSAEATSEPSETEMASLRSDILPGVELTVEEVEPGVFHVVNDGVRELGPYTSEPDIVAGQDGSIWLAHQDGHFVRLGADRSYAWPTDPKWVDDLEYRELLVARDGSVWASGVGNGIGLIHSLNDGKWRERLRFDADRTLPDARSIILAPDGSLWVAIAKGDDEEERLIIRRLGADGWQRVAKATLGGDVKDPGNGELAITDDGEVWWVPRSVGHSFSFDDEGSWVMGEGGRLWRLHTWKQGGGGSEWHEVPVPALVYDLNDAAAGLGTDGMIWFAGVSPVIVDGEPVRLEDSFLAAPAESFVMRYDGTEWQRWGPDDDVPSLTWSWSLELEQAPDGALWITAPPDSWWTPEDAEDLPFDGIARFDGSTWRYFLAGQSISDWVLAADGSVWVLADADLYVITPEAVAAGG